MEGWTGMKNLAKAILAAVIIVLFSAAGASAGPRARVPRTSKAPRATAAPRAAVPDDLNSKLVDAAGKGDTKAVNELIAKGADVNGREATSSRSTPLIAAACNAKVEVARILVEHGAKVNSTNSENTSALNYASYIGNAELVLLLVEHGADINAVDGVGRTPLMWAAVQGNKDAVLVLLKHGADANLRDPDGVTALSMAESTGHKEVMQMLSTVGATK